MLETPGQQAQSCFQDIHEFIVSCIYPSTEVIW